MKTLIIVIVAFGITGGIAAGTGWWLRYRSAAGKEPAQVRVEPASRGDLTEIVTAPGLVQPKTAVSISARVAARIIEIPVVEGDTVKGEDLTTNPPTEGSLLIQLDAKDLKAALQSSQARHAAQESQIRVAAARMGAQEAQISASKVLLADAERDLSRQRELLATKDVSQASVDQLQAKVDELKAQLQAAIQGLAADKANISVMEHNLKAAEADIARAQDALSYTEIRSPINGVVTRIYRKVGELVVIGTMNNPGTVILDVADLSKMLLVARVDEASIAQVEVGQKARVRMQAYQDEVFEGTVDTVALAHTDERDGTKYFKTEILLNTGGRRIYSGLTGDAEIETKRHERVIKVPSQAVLSRAVDDLPAEARSRDEVERSRTMTTVVYRFVNGKAMVTPVAIGASDLTHTVIRSGLNEGDQVITGPYKVLESIAHDQAVKDERTATTQPAAGK